MNKAYKVVFNKLRGAMMVANELTKSHQSGKKAKRVAAAVASAIMAFSVSAPAVSGTWHYNTSTTESLTSGDTVFGGAERTEKTQDSNLSVVSGTFEDIHGGSYMTVGGTNPTIQNEKNTTITVDAPDVTVTGGEIFGGGYLQGEGAATGTTSATLNTGNTKILFKAGKTDGLVLGGSRVLAYVGSYTATTGDTYIEVRGGSIAEAIIGGGLARTQQNSGNSATASSGNTRIEITGGKVGGVVGGGLAQVAGAVNSIVIGSVRQSNITISGGTVGKLNINDSTFDDASIIAGGVVSYRSGDSAALRKSTAEDVSVNVSGGTVNGSIYGGGLIHGNIGDRNEVGVGHSKIVLSGGTVKGNVVSGSLLLNTNLANAQASQIDSKIILTGDAKVTGEIVVGNRVVSPTTYALRSSTATNNLSDIPTTIIFDSRNVQIGGIDTQNNSSNVAVVGSSNLNDSFGSALETVEWMRNINGLRVEDGQPFRIEEGLVNDAVIVTESSVEVQTNSLVADAETMTVRAPLQLSRILTNDVRKRMGDLRAATEMSGAWARWDGGKMSGQGITSKFNTIQVGVDTKPADDSVRLGLAFSYSDGDMEFRRGDSDLQAYSLAAYGTWMGDNGAFADVIARMATVRNELNVDSLIKGKTDSTLLSLSGEFGWRLGLTNTIYAEPQTEITYSYMDSDSFSLSSASYELDATKSLTGRLGLALGVDCPNNRGSAYVRASVVHEFLGDSELTARNGIAVNHIKVDGKDTWVEYAIGANYNINNQTYVWADVERTSGANINEDWRATVGVRYSF